LLLLLYASRARITKYMMAIPRTTMLNGATIAMIAMTLESSSSVAERVSGDMEVVEATTEIPTVVLPGSAGPVVPRRYPVVATPVAVVEVMASPPVVTALEVPVVKLVVAVRLAKNVAACPATVTVNIWTPVCTVVLHVM
jgi:hypothetical protein